MNEKILKSAFQRYYRSFSIPGPPEIERREFGVGVYQRKIAFRHISFQSEKEFQKYLREKVPFYISYSVAYFERPGAPSMEEKGFIGADLIFEFDVDELGLFSEKDVWICQDCSAAGFLKRKVTKCPKCGGKISVTMFPDPEREEKLKEHVEMLVKDFLISDFGFSEREISVNFSGSRGYHIHVRGESVREFGKEARMEIVEYITGQALEPKFFFKGVEKGFIKGPKPGDPGWAGRIARMVMKEKPEVADLIKAGMWPLVYKDEEKTLKYWVDLAKKHTPYAGKHVDVQTSMDIHRLIRVPETIHGGTGLAAKVVNDLKSFNPYKDAVVLGKEPHLRLKIKICPEFEFGGETYGPFKDEEKELPLNVSVYLISKGVAEWI